MKTSYTAEGSSTEHHFVLLVVASKSSKGSIDELEALLVSFLLLFTYSKENDLWSSKETWQSEQK